MRNLFIVLLIFVAQQCFAQKYSFRCYNINPCTGLESLDLNYSIQEIGNDNALVSPDLTGTANLPQKGAYLLRFSWIGNNKTVRIEIKDTGLYVYKYKQPLIVEYLKGMHSPVVYGSCGNLINGFKEDYYDNGKVRIRGNFIKGRPKDSLVTFYNNGAVEKRSKYFLAERKTFYEEFDSLGHHLKTTVELNKPYYRLDLKVIEYFASGKEKLIKTDIDKIERLKEFYPNGKLKTKQEKSTRISYYENGVIKSALHWVLKKDKRMPKQYGNSFKIYKKVYGTDGLLLQSLVYEIWGTSKSQPSFDFAEANWIDKSIEYKSGKIVVRVFDKDPKDYINNYASY